MAKLLFIKLKDEEIHLECSDEVLPIAQEIVDTTSMIRKSDMARIIQVLERHRGTE